MAKIIALEFDAARRLFNAVSESSFKLLVATVAISYTGATDNSEK